jgi:hypothetical protein
VSVTLIDLTPPAPEPARLLDALPRRITLTRRERSYVAGDLPLPVAMDVASLGALRDPVDSLARRGLLDPQGVVDAGLAGAVGLVATGEVAVDLEVVAEGRHAWAWHRFDASAVVTLATADGLVFELAWFPAAQWPIELARVAALPADVVRRDSAVPGLLTLPYELADAAAEAMRTDRADLLAVLAAQHGAGLDLVPVLRALGAEARGRLRAQVGSGVVSWTLLADGWHAIRRTGADVEVRRVAPADLAAHLAPVLAEAAA